MDSPEWPGGVGGHGELILFVSMTFRFHSILCKSISWRGWERMLRISRISGWRIPNGAAWGWGRRARPQSRAASRRGGRRWRRWRRPTGLGGGGMYSGPCGGLRTQRKVVAGGGSGGGGSPGGPPPHHRPLATPRPGPASPLSVHHHPTPPSSSPSSPPLFLSSQKRLSPTAHRDQPRRPDRFTQAVASCRQCACVDRCRSGGAAKATSLCIQDGGTCSTAPPLTAAAADAAATAAAAAAALPSVPPVTVVACVGGGGAG